MEEFKIKVCILIWCIFEYVLSKIELHLKVFCTHKEKDLAKSYEKNINKSDMSNERMFIKHYIIVL